jgi:hypothetical protein
MPGTDFYTLRKRAKAHLSQLAFGSRELIKQAELGVDSDGAFEQAFSQLAHTYLRETAPKLMDKEIGFQLIEKNRENTRAVGIFGFKLGDEWLYAPAFFLNGTLKGHELLYIKSQDIFVPLKDNWVNYLLGRKPALLGQSVNRNLTHLGVQSPSLTQFVRSPYKLAAVAPRWQTWVEGGLAALAPTIVTPYQKLTSYAKRESLPDFLKRAGSGIVKNFLALTSAYPLLFRGFEQFHGSGTLTKIATAVAATDRRCGSILTEFRKSIPVLPPRVKTAAAVRVEVREDYFRLPLKDQDLGPDDREKLIREGILIKDARGERQAARAYRFSTDLALFTPDETNVYDVLIKPDKFERCLVIMGPHGDRGREHFCTLISLARKGRWCNIHPTKVFCRSRLPKSEWDKWYDGLEDGEALPVNKTEDPGHALWVLISSSGQGTCPFSVDRKHGEGSYDVCLQSHIDPCHQNAYWGLPGKYYRERREDDVRKDLLNWDFESSGRGYRVPRDHNLVHVCSLRFVDSLAHQFRMLYGQIFVPRGAKRLSVVTAETAMDPEREVLEPGNLADVQMGLLDNLKPLNLISNESSYFYLDDKTPKSKEAAFKSLVVDYNLLPDVAEEMLKEAAEHPKRTQTYLIKKADPFLTHSGPGAPTLPETYFGTDSVFGSGLPTQPYDVREMQVRDLRPDPGNVRNYKAIGPDPDTVNLAQRAVQTGQKEVFDTAMIGTLLRTVRQDSMVDRDLPNLIKGMDSCGRIYFQLLWHGEEFEDRFGKRDMPELEDTLRNNFEGLGDLILKLKQKSQDPLAEHGMSVDLGGIADQ